MSTDLLNLASNLELVDAIYAQYRRDPASVDVSWRQLFESAGDGLGVTIATASKANGGSNGSLATATGATPLVPPPFLDDASPQLGTSSAPLADPLYAPQS